jgi:hypoxanthine-DNA glycosylase
VLLSFHDKQSLSYTSYMIETHLFGIFVPPNAKYLLLGSFVARTYSKNENYDWYYGRKVNQFWPIIEKVYNTNLPNKKSKQKLFTKLGIAIGDIIHQCERRDGTNLDSNLINIVYNTSAIKKTLQENNIQKIFFTSRFVEKTYKTKLKELVSEFPHIELVTLPSPSPRYASMRKEEKIKRYKEILPKN